MASAGGNKVFGDLGICLRWLIVLVDLWFVLLEFCLFGWGLLLCVRWFCLVVFCLFVLTCLLGCYVFWIDVLTFCLCLY